MKHLDVPAIAGGTQVRDRFLVFGAPVLDEDEINEVVDTLRSGWLGTGPKVQRFREAFRRYIGAEHAVAVSSGTAGLHLALRAIRIEPGDEVITSPLTFVATANVIVHCGAVPVFVDVDPQSLNIDPQRIEAAITPRTKAIVPVHLYGRPCEMDAIMAIARHQRLFVVEDAAHATETVYRGRKVGTIGDCTAFSFYATKNLCTGEGGMVTTNRSDWADEMERQSLHGLSRDAWKRYSAEGYQPYDTLSAGYKYNMMDLQAALGLHQLDKLEEHLRIREQYWHMYDEAFRDEPTLSVPDPHLPEDSRHARHLYTLQLHLDHLSISRDEVIVALKRENIGAGVHFWPVHLHSHYRRMYPDIATILPNATLAGKRTLSLPLSPYLSEQDVQDVIAATLRIVRYFRK